MEKHVEKELMVFVEFCKNAKKIAASKCSLCDIQSFIEKISIRERYQFIYSKMKEYYEQVIKLDRLDYFLLIKDINKLFELFEKEGNLSNEEELDKLEQVFIISKEYKQIMMIYFETIMMDYRLNRKNHEFSDIPFNNFEMGSINFNQMMEKMNDLIHLVKPPTKIEDFATIAITHDWDQVKDTYYMGCQTNELKCFIDELFPHHKELIYDKVGKCGCFISRKGKPITTHCLESSTYEKLKTRDAIRKIIAQYRQTA